MFRLIVASLLLAGLFHAPSAVAAGVRIAVVAPTEEIFAALGKQIVDGAAFLASDRGSQIVPIAETCGQGGNEGLAKAIIASGAEAAIGFLCTESLEAALPGLAEAGIPAVSLSVRSGILMEDALKKNWPFYRLAPSARAESDRIADVIITQWATEPFALVEDGTIYGRELAESVRAKLADAGLVPVFTDTFRPAQEQQIGLVRRLAKGAATHVFIGGDRSDTAIIARDAAAEGFRFTLLGGEALNAPNTPIGLADGVLAVALPDPGTLDSARETAERMRAAGVSPDGYVLPAHAAMVLLEQAKDVAAAESISLAQALAKGPYDTVLGTIEFDARHERLDNPYRLLRWQGGRFVTVQGTLSE